MAQARVAIGIPMYGQSGPLRLALESLLGQTYRDFRLVLVDDRSPDDTLDVVREVARDDARVELHVNEQRLGMLGNTNRAFRLAREHAPEAEFWALGSDHDVWEPTWLERLVDTLDAHPSAVLAYPRSRRIDAAGREVSGSWRFDTAGDADPRRRLRLALRRMVSGDMIYGLFRTAPLDPHVLYRPVLAPDRLLLSMLALRGEFVQVPEVLWSRRYVGLASLERQRRAFWPRAAAPLHTRLPWWLVHAAIFGHERGWHGALVDYLPASVAFRLRARALGARNALLLPPLRAVLRSVAGGRIARRVVVPALRESREVLDRLVREAEVG